MPARGQAGIATYMAWDGANNIYKTGDAANHVISFIKDGVLTTPANSPTQVSSAPCPGAYTIAWTSAEALCTTLWVGGKSSSVSVSIIPITIGFDNLPLTFASGAIAANIVQVNGIVTQTSQAQLGVNVVTIPALTQTVWPEPVNPLPIPTAATLQQMISLGYALAINSIVSNPTSILLLANTSGATIATWNNLVADTQVVRGRAS